MASNLVHQTHFPDDESSMVKVGVVGCGRIGMLHLEALTKAPGVLPIICSNPHVRNPYPGGSTSGMISISFHCDCPAHGS